MPPTPRADDAADAVRRCRCGLPMPLADAAGFSLLNSSAPVHEMSGALSFSSDGKGRGSAFRLEVPIQASERPAGDRR
jgi:hypothetical protein